MRILACLGACVLAGLLTFPLPGAVSAATGDNRAVSQPSIPATCATVVSTLSSPVSRLFANSQEGAPPDTTRIQTALARCAGTGKTVELKASGSNMAFLSGPLTVGSGETLLVDTGVTLFAAVNAARYQVAGEPTCGTVAASGGGCVPFLTVSGANAAVMGTQSGSGSQGKIDGRGDLKLYGGTETWWQLATDARNNGGIQNNPWLLGASGNNFVLYDIDLLNSPIFHVVLQNASGFTVWGVRIKTPASARNTDGIDPVGATNVTITHSYIQAGDDGIAVKAGSWASKNITISDNHFYGTHGISIGSETNAGVSNVLVRDNTIQGSDSAGIVSSSDNGLRIKSDSSRGGKVSQVTYTGTCMSGVAYPLVFDPHYSSSTGSLIPYFTDILVNGAKAISSASGAQPVLNGYSSSYPLGLTLENISFDATRTMAQYANIGVYNSNITASGTGVTVGGVSGGGSVPNCGFPSYPGL
jgi:polygalacturonase